MDQQQIDALYKLARKATPGPWRTSSRTPARNCPKSIVLAADCVIAEVKSTRTFAHKYGSRNDIRAWDAEYIAAVNPLAILELLEHISSLEKQLDWLAETCDEFDSDLFSEKGVGNFVPTDWRLKAKSAVEAKNDNF